MFNFCRVTCTCSNYSPQENFRVFNFHRLSHWRKFFNSENFPIYGIKSIGIFTHTAADNLQCSKNVLISHFTGAIKLLIVHWPTHRSCSLSANQEAWERGYLIGILTHTAAENLQCKQDVCFDLPVQRGTMTSSIDLSH